MRSQPLTQTRSKLALTPTPASAADGELGATIHHATFPGPVVPGAARFVNIDDVVLDAT